MSSIYTSGTGANAHTLAVAISNPEFSAPLPGQATNYVLRQRFQQLLASFAPLALNTAHPSYADYKLVSEDDKADVGALECRWTRTYAKVPASYSEPGGNYVYQYIGFYGSFGVNVTTTSGRARFTRSSPVKIQRDFFLVGAGQTYLTAEAIPKISEQRYLSDVGSNFEVDYLADNTELVIPTSPTKTAYLALLAADAASEDSFSLVPEASTVTRWLGNIFMRETRYIKAL